jgi:hypothetical protein
LLLQDFCLTESVVCRSIGRPMKTRQRTKRHSDLETASSASFLQALKKEASDCQAQAQADGMAHLAPHEINEIYGSPLLNRKPPTRNAS